LPNALNFRFAKPDEIHEIGRLVAHSFPGSGRTPETWQEQLADPVYGGGADTLVVGEDNGRPAAALQIHRMEQWVGGVALPMAGVGTVTVSPTHRKRRVAGQLMETAFRMAVARGDILSVLYPFRISFYQQLGYGLAGEAHQYQLPVDSLPPSDERDHVELVQTEAVEDEVLAFYDSWARGQTGQLARNKRVFSKILNVTDRALFAYRRPGAGTGAGIEGYAIVNYRTDLPRRERYLEVDELVWSTTAARRGLYGWLSTLGDQWDQVMIRALPSHRMADWVREPRLPHGQVAPWLLWSGQATVVMGPMSRILDVQRAWSRRRINAGPAMSVAMEIRDKCVGGNEGAWRFDLADGGVAVEPLKGALPVTISCDISTLSRLYMSSLNTRQALEAGLLECDRPEHLAALDAALVLPEPWTFDRF
jgi:predicted acetyltransferase